MTREEQEWHRRKLLQKHRKIGGYAKRFFAETDGSVDYSVTFMWIRELPMSCTICGTLINVLLTNLHYVRSILCHFSGWMLACLVRGLMTMTMIRCCKSVNFDDERFSTTKTTIWWMCKKCKNETAFVFIECDQMTRLFVECLDIYNNGNVPKSITSFPK